MSTVNLLLFHASTSRSVWEQRSHLAEATKSSQRNQLEGEVALGRQATHHGDLCSPEGSAPLLSSCGGDVSDKSYIVSQSQKVGKPGSEW